MTTTTALRGEQQRRWFIDAFGVWHRQHHLYVAECGAIAARGIGPMLGGAPANGIVCPDCEDDDP